MFLVVISGSQQTESTLLMQLTHYSQFPRLTLPCLQQEQGLRKNNGRRRQRVTSRRNDSITGKPQCSLHHVSCSSSMMTQDSQHWWHGD